MSHDANLTFNMEFLHGALLDINLRDNSHDNHQYTEVDMHGDQLHGTPISLGTNLGNVTEPEDSTWDAMSMLHRNQDNLAVRVDECMSQRIRQRLPMLATTLEVEIQSKIDATIALIHVEWDNTQRELQSTWA
jgi:hypothetical protein